MAKKETKKNELKQDTTQQEKMKALEATLSSIEKEFGKGTVMKLGEKTAMQVDVVPTGCLDLDIALGVGGIPRGRIVEVFGPESSGKTTVALHVVAQTRWKSRKPCCAAALSTSWSSTPWPRWCPGPKSTAKWATPSWASRPA